MNFFNQKINRLRFYKFLSWKHKWEEICESRATKITNLKISQYFYKYLID